MSKWSEKFDKLPQDFDKEAIWDGIDKPKASGVFHLKNMLWASAVVFASVTLFFTSKGLNDNELTAESIMKTSTEVLSKPSQNNLIEKQPELVIQNQKETIHFNSEKSIPPTPKKESTNSFASTIEENFSHQKRRVSNQKIKPSVFDTETKKGIEKNKAEIILKEKLEVYENKNTVQELAQLPLINISLKTLQKELRVSHQKIEPIKNNFAKNNLIIRTGIGTHQSSFSSSDGEEQTLRTQLEKAQLDYSLGIAYERKIDRSYFVSLSLDYTLIKDKIITTHIDESLDMPLEFDYKLHNHYHVFSGEVGLGRRFLLKRSFIDMNGGLGIKLYQTVEADYFVNQGQLAPESQIDDIYQNDSDLYFTGKVAFGKYLTNRIFMRTGAQVRPKIKLSASSAEIEHNVTPTHLFVEFGMRF